jgi:hypothetical protein
MCAVANVAALPRDPYATTVAVESLVGGVWTLQNSICNARGTVPRVGPWDAYDAVRKVVPPVAIRSGPATPYTLVNIETVFWAVTQPQRALGTVTLLGRYRVALRIRLQSVEWIFGDGEQATSADAGRPIIDADSCGTKQCPGFFGHTYVRVGPVRVSATIRWAGQYQVDGGAWLDIAQPVNGPTTLSLLTVRQARAQLIANPTPR